MLKIPISSRFQIPINIFLFYQLYIVRRLIEIRFLTIIYLLTIDRNAILQRKGLEMVEPVLEEAILSMKITVECKKFGIADLGCSSGPNALFAAENIIKSLKARYVSAGITVPQCQVFFNDLPASDFNSLFRILPSFSVNTDHQNEEGVAGRSYFAAGVPGSFYGRLFPDKALHFVHSSFGLHWLSQVCFHKQMYSLLDRSTLVRILKLVFV